MAEWVSASYDRAVAVQRHAQQRRLLISRIISLVISVAPAVGPTLSGLLLQLGSWRYIFGFVLPIAVGMLLLGRALLRAPAPGRAPPGAWARRATWSTRPRTCRPSGWKAARAWA